MSVDAVAGAKDPVCPVDKEGEREKVKIFSLSFMLSEHAELYADARQSSVVSITVRRSSWFVILFHTPFAPARILTASYIPRYSRMLSSHTVAFWQLLLSFRILARRCARMRSDFGSFALSLHFRTPSLPPFLAYVRILAAFALSHVAALAYGRILAAFTRSQHSRTPPQSLRSAPACAPASMV